MAPLISFHNQLTESLWGDESFSALAIQQPLKEMLGIVMRDTAPPLFYLLGFIWGRLFGFSEIALRSLSLLLIIGASIFASLIVYHFQKNKLVAILTGLLAFLSPFLTPFAFEWRMYALLVFTLLGSTYFFVTRKWFWYLILSTAALYTHHFAFFTIAGQIIWFLLAEFHWRQPQTYLKQLKPFLILAFLYLPWLYPMYLQIFRVKTGGFWLIAPTLSQILDLMYRFLTGGVAPPWRLWVTLGIALLLLTKKWKQVGKNFLSLLVIFLTPVLLAATVSYLITPIFYDRYLLSVIVGMAVLIGIGINKWAIPVLLTLTLVYGYFSFHQFTHPHKLPFRELAAYVKQEMTDQDYLINYNGAAHHLWESHYYGLTAPIYTPHGPLPLYVGTAQMKPTDTITTLPQVENRLGVIASEPITNIQLPKYHLIEFHQFDRLTISWWQPQ